jgi:hypothetical protein
LKNEQVFFERFKSLYEPLKDIPFKKNESPDFTSVNTGGVTIGVEVTELLNKKEPESRFSPVQQHSLESRIVKLAEKKFINSYGIPLHVSFWFQDDIQCRKGEEPKYALYLSKLISGLVEGKNLSESFSAINCNPVYDFLVYFDIHYNPSFKSSVWNCTKAKMVPNADLSIILELIKRKEVKIDLYRRKSDIIYLLIIEGILPFSWFDHFDEIEGLKLVTAFDKVFIMRTLHNSFLELK